MTRSGGRLELDAPATLFSYPLLPYASGGVPSRTYAVTADGRRILGITVPEASRPRQIDVVTDWAAELARQVPEGE
jgi:hypothetical protein